MNKLRTTKIILINLLVINSFILAVTPTNFYSPYDINWRLTDCKDKSFLLAFNIEAGDSTKSRDMAEHKRDLLKMYNTTESSLAMLMGDQKDSDIYNLANLLIPAYNPSTDDGVRGHFDLGGRFSQEIINVQARYKLPIETIPGNFDFYFHVPFTHMKLSNVSWTDLTKEVLSSDLDVHKHLTDDIFNNVKNLGDGLDLTGFEYFTLSDVVTQLWWYMDYKQTKEHLKNVRINCRIGLTIPTGHEQSENKILDMPTGNDGSWGIPMAAGIDLTFIRDFRAGLEFEMLFSLDNTKIRRLKTDSNQTDFLLLHKGEATRSPGMVWKFNLYMQKRFAKYFTAKLAYNFFRHDSDDLTAESNNFDYSIINTAERYQEWSYQNVIFQLNCDLFKQESKYKVKPQISLFAKLPIAGKRVIDIYTFGGQIGFNF